VRILIDPNATDGFCQMKDDYYLLVNDRHAENARSDRKNFKRDLCVFFFIFAVLGGVFAYVVVGNRQPILEQPISNPGYPQTPAASIYPSQILNLLSWGLAMRAYPEISVRNLFRLNDSFVYVNQNMDSVVFRGPIVHGEEQFPNLLVETNGSYIANWNPNIGFHTLEMTEQVHSLGAAQSVTIMMIRDCCQVLAELTVIGNRLQVRNRTYTHTLDDAYEVGAKHRLRVLVGQRRAQFFYDDDLHFRASLMLPESTTAHFMVGTATNPDMVDKLNATEVWIEFLRVRHRWQS
jgi:hypothetical protein